MGFGLGCLKVWHNVELLVVSRLVGAIDVAILDDWKQPFQGQGTLSHEKV